MFLFNEEKKIVLYDLDFNNRSEVLKIAKSLASDSIKDEEIIMSENEYAKWEEQGDKRAICEPVYVRDENEQTKIIRYTSKTPYTLAMVAYYAKNNWIQSLYRSLDYKDKNIYLKKLVDRMMSCYLMFPQLYMTKCHFDGDNYRQHDRLFQNLKKDDYAMEFFIEQYYPDLKAFMDLFPYIDFIEEEVYGDNSFKGDAWQSKSAEHNTETLKQLGLTPNIRKKQQ